MRLFVFVWPSSSCCFLHARELYPFLLPLKSVKKTPVKPIYVDILNSSLTLVADRKYEIHCVTSGSRPDAVITWLKGKKSLKRIRDYTKNNQTTSILNFVPSIEDNGKMLTCHAENPNVAGMFVEDNWNMSVFCKCFDCLNKPKNFFLFIAFFISVNLDPPVISLQLGSKLQAGDIKEGDDVYFECRIDANPKFRRLTWLHNVSCTKPEDFGITFYDHFHVIAH